MAWTNMKIKQEDAVANKLSEIECVLDEVLDVSIDYHTEPDNDCLRAFIDLEFSSNLGEDCCESIEFRDFKDLNVDGFAKLLREYADNFDVDDHAEMYVGERGKHGVPNVSITELVKDAQGIKDYLYQMADEVEKYQLENGKQQQSSLINESALEDCLYEIYKENWLCENVPSAERLDIRRQYEIDFLVGDETRDFDEYINEEGYNGALYASREEFLTNEYEDREFVASLLNQSGIDRDTVDEIMSSYDAYKEIREQEEEIDGRDDI